ncbi:hypothetical protein HUZ95_09160 [Cronobacter turicensis]|uniref:hypothetical protein n=1 Tax=Cronobacter turicensis TaxID=413502 RepID=UPI0015881BC0|nr:hypothetical protein [Cronobacter turicensis]NUW55389.1 hypothetical protein [Cronobacter turicensis]
MKRKLFMVAVLPIVSALTGCANIQIPTDTAAREHFFLQEEHNIEATCGWLGPISVGTGAKPYVYSRTTREFMTATNPRFKDGSWFVEFNSDSLTFAYTPSADGNNGRAGVIDSSGITPCRATFISN